MPSAPYLKNGGEIINKNSILILLIIAILTGCNNQKLKHNDDISKRTEEIMLESNNNNYQETLSDNKTIEEKNVERENIQNNEKPKETNNESKEEQIKESETIKIDCHEIDECMDITMPIQFNYQELIADISYLEITEDSKKLGYFIDYTFRPHTYENEDTCKMKRAEIKDLLKDHIKSIGCTDTTLTIIPNKEGSDPNESD